MNLDHLVYCCRYVVVLIYLPASLDIISIFNLQCFIDLSIALFVSFLEYIDLTTIKKLINLDYLACSRCCACCSQCFRIFLVSFPNLLIRIMLMNLDRLVVIAIAVCLVLQSPSTLFYYCCLSCFVVVIDCFILLLLSAQLIELTLIER